MEKTTKEVKTEQKLQEPAQKKPETKPVNDHKDQNAKELSEKITELTTILKRVQADFENYKKRAEKEKAEFIQYASADFIKQLLPLIDSFEIALKNTSDKDRFIEGVNLIYAELMSLLNANGLKRIDTDGKKFDPYAHEALMREPSDKEDGTILEELQPGYALKNCILRYAKVKIAKNSSTNSKLNDINSINNAKTTQTQTA